MKRIYQLLAAAVVTLFVPLIASTPSMAAVTCNIGFTGPDSQNMCTSKETYICSVTNTNEVEITNTSGQEVASGDVSTNGNTSGGAATSGTVTNESGTTFTVTIKNANPNTQEPGVCTATVIVPAVVTPETPTTPTPAATSAPAVLPATSAETVPVFIAVAAGSLLIIGALAASIIVAYKHMHKL